MPPELPGFDLLREWATRDPARLEALRQQLSEQLIAHATPDQQLRLRGLQFRIDMELRRARNDLAACIALSGLMHESFDRLRQLLGAPPAVTCASSSAPGHETAEPISAAKVLPFGRKA